MNERLYRSREDRLIGGVCAGVADRLDLDPSIVRVGWVLLTIFTGGAFLVLYIVMLVVVPEEPLGGFPPAPPTPPTPGPGAVPGWQGPEAAVPGWQGPEAAAGVGLATTGWQAPPGSELPAGADGEALGGAPAEGAPASATAAGAAAAGWVAPDQAYAARRAERVERHRRREGTIGLVFGLLLILLGIWFLFREYIPQVDLEVFWPIAIIALGVLLLVRAFRLDRGGDAS